VRALSAAPLGVPGKALRLRRPGGYQARLRRPGNAVPSRITHPLKSSTSHASLISCSCSELYCNSSILPIRSRPEAVETNIAGAGVVSKTDRLGHVPQETVSLVALIADKERCPFRLLCVSIPQ